MLYTLTNIAPGNRGFGLADGSTLALASGATSEPVDLSKDEVADAEATGWFKVDAVKAAKTEKPAA